MADALIRRAVVGSWVALAMLWLLQVFGGVTLAFAARALTVVALAATAVAVGVGLWRLLASPGSPARTRQIALLGILALAFLVRFAGLDFELMDAPIGDEGVFHKVATDINSGKPFPQTFNYGHLLYYLGAFAIWFYDLFPTAMTGFWELFYTTLEGYGVQRLLLKGVNASLAAVAAGAVFGASYSALAKPGDDSGERTALLGGVLGGALITFSPIYNDVAHQLIADVPAGAFAAFCLYFVARLVHKESLRDYLLAGVMAGLAAAGKYPGGLVALAIFAIWLRWRLKTRSWSWDLLWAALVSFVTLIATMPALFVYPETALGGEGLDIFFGFRQYAFGGWLGVQPESNLVWYVRELSRSFSWPVLILGLAGFFRLSRRQQRHWLWLAVFPIGYLTLIFSMSMVVQRNLEVVLPALAILLGAGLAASVSAVAARSRTMAVTVALGVLFMPVWWTVAWDISRMRPGTRHLARAWLEENVPEGASIVRERYTPTLDPERFAFVSHRFAAWQDPEEMRSGEWDYLILAWPAYSRFLEAGNLTREHEREYRRRYEIMLGFDKAAEFAPTRLRAGPLLTIFELEPEAPVLQTDRTFLPPEATFISHPDLRRDGPRAPLQYTRRWQFAVFKDFFAGGKYRVELGVNPPIREGYLHVIDRRKVEVGSWDLRQALTVELPRDEKYLLRVFIAPPTRLYGIRLAAASEGAVVSDRLPPK
ncbi:MAG: ArnT family glycosyltransferase [Thermoanaerobaculia bacterium]